MNEESALFALYQISQQLRPLIEQHGGRLLKVTFEIEGRQVTYTHDDQGFPPAPEPERQMAPPVWPPGVKPPMPPPPPPPPLKPTVSQARPAASTSQILGSPPLPPLPPLPPGYKPTSAAKAPANKRLEPVEGIDPLTDEDICPIQKKHPNTLMRDIPADYLDWLYGQPWLRTRYPKLWAYCVRHEDVITKELRDTGAI